jgi:bacteriorhodopsin
MLSPELVKLTTQLSIGVQVVTGVLGLASVTTVLPEPHAVLVSVLWLEIIVQIIELGFYFWFVSRFHLLSFAARRYFDWVISTPIMLLTMMLYFTYTRQMENDKPDSNPLTLWSFIQDNRHDILWVFAANLAMLVFGFLGETGVIPLGMATVFGFAGLALSFSIIYWQYARHSKVGRNMFVILSIVWSLYGIAFLFPPMEKNISYNVLDIIAKNFFGLYLVVIIQRLRQKMGDAKSISQSCRS